MVSHEYKCIFIHIPKCAGTSIEDALGHNVDHTGRGSQDHRSIRMIEQPLINPNIFLSKENTTDIIRRIRHKYIKGRNPRNNFTVTRDQYNSYFKFTIVRNPWARAFSWYKAVMQDDIIKRQLKITGYPSLNEALREYAGKGLLKHQTYWIKEFSGKIPLDYVAKFETLNKDFQEICKALQIPKTSLPHKVKGSSLDYHEQYDKDSIKIIAEVYKEEISLFGYSFDQ